jgi:hypothetical protein
VSENLADRPRLGDEGDQPDVAAAVWALEWELLAYPGQEFRPGNPRRVVRAGLLIRVAAAFRGVTAAPMLAGSGVTPFVDVPDRQRRDGFSQLVVRRKHPTIPIPVLARRRDEIGEPVARSFAGERRRTGLLVADRLAAWFTANSGEAGFEETSSGGGAFRAEHHFTAGMNKKGH